MENTVENARKFFIFKGCINIEIPIEYIVEYANLIKQEKICLYSKECANFTKQNNNDIQIEQEKICLYSEGCDNFVEK